MNGVVTVKGREMVRDLLQDNKAKFSQALQNGIDVEHFNRTALTMIQGSSKLLSCTQVSLFNAILQSAQLSLHLDGLLGQAYLVPYKDKAVMIIGYKGLRELALRTERYKDIRARVVYEKDFFKIELGTNEFITHRPFEGDRGEMRGCYAVAVAQDGTAVSEFMFKAEIEKHRDQFSQGYKTAEHGYPGKKGKKDSPWHTSPAAMWEKTLVRKICGRLQMSVKAQQAMQRESLMDAGIDIPDEDVIDIEPDPTPSAEEKPKETPPGNLEEALDSKTGEDGLSPKELEQAGKYEDLQLAIADHIEGLYPGGSDTVKQTQFNAWASKVMGKKGKYQADQVSLSNLEKIWALIQEGG